MVDRGAKIELFGCSGGMAEGFRRAGIDFDLSFDLDPQEHELKHLRKRLEKIGALANPKHEAKG